MKAPHIWAQDQELKKAKEAKDAKDAELAKEGATNAQAGSASSAKSTANPGRAPTTWYIGQKTPASYTKENVPSTWKMVKAGDQCPWDSIIAKCTMEEYNMNKT